MADISTWQCVVALALNDDRDRWLMHRRPAHKHHGGLWEFPGGKVEKGETPSGALVREIEEELGIAIDPGRLTPAGFAQGASAAKGPAIVILLYTSIWWDGRPASREGGEARWFCAREIAELPRPPLDIALCDGLFAKTPT